MFVCDVLNVSSGINLIKRDSCHSMLNRNRVVQSTEPACGIPTNATVVNVKDNETRHASGNLCFVYI